MVKKRSVLSCVLLLILAAEVLPGQVLKGDRRHFAWLEKLRRGVLGQLMERPNDRALRDRVAKLLVKHPGDRSPLGTLGHAYAALQRVKGDDGNVQAALADEALLFRHSLMLFAMPEIVDPSRDPEKFGNVGITVHLPRGVVLTGKASFRLRVLDAGGKEVHRSMLGEDKVPGDLRSFQTSQKVAILKYAEGRYRAVVDVIVNGQEPRDHDPVLSVVFHVRRDFLSRFEGVVNHARKLVPGLHETDGGVLAGVLREVKRVFFGEPGLDPASAAADLGRAERVAANLRAKRPALHGMRGWVPVDLPGKDALQVAVRMDHATKLAKPSATSAPTSSRPTAGRRPLVIFVPGVPSWDRDENRPGSPPSTAPLYVAAQLDVAKFDQDARCQVVVCESPGRVKNVLPALERLPQDLAKFVQFRSANAFSLSPSAKARRRCSSCYLPTRRLRAASCL